MLTRTARVVGAALLCGVTVLGLAAGSATAKGARARSSVIGGRAATLQEWGFTAAVLTPNTLCTGVVMAPTKVLTAAHCVGDLSTTLIRTNSTSAFGGGELSAVATSAVAPSFTGGFQNDLAMLTLKTATTAPPIELASAAEDATFTQLGAPLAVAGFGNQNPLLGRQRIGVLTSTDVVVKPCPLPAWAICDSGARAGAAIRKFKGHRIRRKVKASVCSGDSGGPLIARTPAGPRLIGIAEASSGPRKPNPFFFVICGLKGFPGLHTRASAYLSFIQGSLAS